MAEFTMPSLGADMTQGTLRRWLVKPGDKVKQRDLIAEIETEKGIVDAEVYVAGTVDRLLAEPGQVLPVGAPMAVIREEGQPIAPAPPSPEVATTRTRVSPLARRRAQELGVDLTKVTATGPGGAISVEDVERVAGPPSPPTAPAADAAARMRQVIASAMTRSKREIPHYYLSTTIDFGPATEWLAKLNDQRPVTERLLPAVLLVRAVALALRETPELNARWEGSEARPSKGIHVGVAVALRAGGLVAPAIHDADQLPLERLMESLKDIVQRARSGALTTSEMFEGTITLTNLGDRGVETVFPVIYPPQVAIVGAGRVVERPWVVNGQVVPRPVMTCSLAADHRVSDGHRGALFLAAVERLLTRPESLQ